jgi:hypothetical protein
MKKRKQILKIKSDLKESLNELVILRKSKKKKQTLTDFLDEIK